RVPPSLARTINRTANPGGEILNSLRILVGSFGSSPPNQLPDYWSLGIPTKEAIRGKSVNLVTEDPQDANFKIFTKCRQLATFYLGCISLKLAPLGANFRFSRKKKAGPEGPALKSFS